MATKLKEFPGILVRNYMAHVNTFIVGKPAIGKSEMIAKFAEQMRQKVANFEVFMFYAPTMSPMDIQASAPNYETGKLVLYNNAALPNAYDNPDMKGVIFFGEMPNADPATAKLLQKYVNGEDMSGCLRKPDGVMVIADGNRLEDKSGVNSQGRALMSRFEQHDAYTDANDNLEYAAKMEWHPIVQTFMKEYPAMIDNYDDVFETSQSASARSAAAQQANGKPNATSEEGKRGIWANMRAWERLSKKEYAADSLSQPDKPNVLTRAEVTGNVGAAVGMQYEAHKMILSKLASLDEVVASPDTAPIPKKTDEQYMIAMMLAMKVTVEHFPAVMKYMQRMPMEFQAVLLRQMAKRKGITLATCPGYVQWVSSPELNKLLTGR